MLPVRLVCAQQVKEDEEDVLHRRSLRSVVMLGKRAGTTFKRSFYEFAIDRQFHSELRTFANLAGDGNPALMRFDHGLHQA